MKKKNLGVTLLQCALYTLLFFVCQVAASFIGQAVITAGVLNRGVPLSESIPLVEQGYNHVFYEMLILSALFFLGVLALIKRGRLVSDLSATPPRAADGFAGLFLGLGAYFVTTLTLPVILTLLPSVMQSQEEYMETFEAINAAAPSLWADMVYACVMAPLVEEILCRGIIQNKLKQHMPPFFAILIAALVFALNHGNSYQIAFSLPLGILLGYVAHQSGSLWPSVLLHAGFNFGNYLVRCGSLFGYEEESESFALFALAGIGFCALSLLLGILFWAMGRDRRSATALFERRATPGPDFYSVTVTHPNPGPHGEPIRNEDMTMAAPEYLIVGLGNPGEKYSANRHNCGFMALDYIALRQGVQIKNLRFRALVAEAVLEGKKVLLMKPQTFMNLSGESVREAAAFYKIPPQKILVIFDDINFEPGVFRIRPSGSAGGHNGIKSVIGQLSSDAFPRIKMGVGAVPPGWDLMNWVLANPSKEDLDKIIASMEDVYSTARLFASDRLDQAMGLYNGKRHGE